LISFLLPEKLAGLLDDKQASKFTQQLFTALEDHRLLTKLQKNRRKRVSEFSPCDKMVQ
jgi:hypothetical protein